jgi:L,D-transpeptidase ErfK/SrfK
VPPPPALFDEQVFASKVLVAYALPWPAGTPQPRETVIGRVRAYRVREGDTLLDIARYYDLGYDEITDANPGVDPWVPPVGATITLPTSWVVPCCAYEGIVLNIPEMRLYFYRRPAEDPDTLLVVTHPVGLGRADWRTPKGRFAIRGKTHNPTWVIPASIRTERARERGDRRRVIPGGHPENPLGKHRLELTIPLYAIHGTNSPWGIGRQVSHGCAQLYPEDIERLFPLVEPGTPVEFAYQPIKVGTREGAVYLEVHRDIYGYAPVTEASARTVLDRRGGRCRVDAATLRASLARSRGMPVRLAPAAERMAADVGQRDPS